MSNDNYEEQEVFQRIQTHFPPAKIKKIMQTDEDIGKVSQATPVIAGRALELFVAMLVSQAGQTARSQGNKRISADTLRETIMHSEKFDFLREAVCGDDVDDDDDAAAAAATTED
ncbi:similar to Saccharomyces cerevisiae YER159C BUR6 Subunit of a heterodimeric NC2 transcription regulator complex with Ncb2p [Maudiozyma saulgeensis]|uniref:Similar to Saccharomyces cerevisiae YER159C BUR6 Subunit of a heterodimeric NC2 transcription regulator complex with Ncb2p n=1 Tax=Maudiozyma saulgeensis TaxID=1789683 RepID=A0A1X7R7U1_9SACH|nr:similar to Saccharomyces cerevisiae YER159C BUR6 Subunit of a heterodimeric NC2 transcription regulator complex with Ncb2p [Kazachstania saulgeensis]